MKKLILITSTLAAFVLFSGCADTQTAEQKANFQRNWQAMTWDQKMTYWHMLNETLEATRPTTPIIVQPGYGYGYYGY